MPAKFPSKLLTALALAACILPRQASAQPAAPPPPAGIEGTWTGTLSFSGIDLRIVFHIAKAGTGWTATIDSPDQGANGIPVSRVAWGAGQLSLESARIGGSYAGTLSGDRLRLDGTWSQGTMALPLTLHKVDRVSGPARPQTPQKPYPYAEMNVRFPSLAAGVMLDGTLTLPKGAEPHQAVVLVSGSGPEDRDEVVFGHRIFLVLADNLTRRGFAVLRYDKRGVGRSTGSFATATTADFADDAQAAVEFLRGRPEVMPGHVGILGHSEGGLVAPLVASRCRDVAFIVLIGAPGVPGDQIMIQQFDAIARADGEPEAKLARQREAREQRYALIRKEAASANLEADLAALIERQMATEGPDDAGLAGAGPARKMAKIWASPWFRTFVTYDPRPALEKATCPVLAVDGALDLQVLPAQNLPAIAAALKAGGNSHVTVRELPGLNHLLQEARTGSPAEYGRIEQTMSPAALRLIGDWMAAQSQG